MPKHINVSRTFDAPVEQVWALWTDPELVKRWWGPDRFTCPMARIDFREGGTSYVSMKAAPDMGGGEHFNRWAYIRIVPYTEIEFLQNLVDAAGNPADPVAFGLPADFPSDVRTTVTFRELGDGKTQMTVILTADFGSIGYFAQIGLEQSVAKMALGAPAGSPP